MLENDIFKRYKPNYSKLKTYGFCLKDDCWVYDCKICNDEFLAKLCIINDKMHGKIIDLDTDFEYTSFRVDSDGEFAGNIKNNYVELLNDIRDKCFELRPFVSSQACRIAECIYQLYGDLPFYEWESTPDTGVFKHNITKKWYGIIMNVKKEKLSSGDEFVDVLNVKLEPLKINELLKDNGFYPAYHMNKKNWISIILDETISDNDIMCLIKESYSFASNNKK